MDHHVSIILLGTYEVYYSGFSQFKIFFISVFMLNSSIYIMLL